MRALPTRGRENTSWFHQTLFCSTYVTPVVAGSHDDIGCAGSPRCGTAGAALRMAGRQRGLRRLSGNDNKTPAACNSGRGNFGAMGMDFITQFISGNKIPVGAWGKSFFAFLTTNFEVFFDSISRALSFFLEGLASILLAIPPLLIILATAGLAWYLQKSWKLGLAVLIGLLFILNQGMWKETVQTIVLVVGATAVSMAIGVPLGIWAAHNVRVYRVMLPVLDLMQTMPTFVYLIPVLFLFGLGAAPALIVTVIFAAPAPIRLTHLGITSVPRALLEAGEAFGATKRQLLWKVELPSALPTIMAGLTQCIMLSLSMVVIAALIGASGLGKPVVNGLNRMDIKLGIEAGLCIVILAIMLDRMCRVGQGAHK